MDTKEKHKIKEKAIKKVMKYYKKDMLKEKYNGNDFNAFMNVTRKGIEEFIIMVEKNEKLRVEVLK